MAKNNINGINIFYRENSADEFVLNHSFEKDIYLLNIKGYTPKSGDIIIDIGAHIGTFAIYLASISAGINVYAIEASKDTYSYLQKNINENNISNVHSFHIALSGQIGKIKLFHDLKSGNWGHSISKNISDSFEEVEATTLNEFIKNNNIGVCDLVKLNCEGAEFDILLNTDNNILSKSIKRLIILYHEDLSESSSYKSLLRHLKNSNFATTILFKEKKRGWIIAQNKNLVSFSEIFSQKVHSAFQILLILNNKLLNRFKIKF